MSEAENNDKAQVGIDRSSARLAAVQALYEMDMTDITADSVINEFLKQRWKPSPGMQNDEEEDLPDLADPDGALLAELIRGVSAKRNDLDGMIGPALSADWTVDRLETILRAVLRAGTFELLSSDVPARVVINEYVNVSKAFFDDNKPGMVNGVLDKLARVLRTAEMEK
ncbi:MAG: transcription antitermination factor NusB [Rhodospirillales bacterium]|jgi:N utilization substance protein B|nr:transcription antitermination factor NusB [Rhodospirillales bacterium]HJN25004.1 transcription antitermination factor NusB [Rhodospirillales bacterium]|tara:strand:- start:360 stop:866 length:507 start_codon:yes stop_codon:yes gene_type:complete